MPHHAPPYCMTMQRISVSLPDQIHDLVTFLAEVDERPVSSMARKLITEGLDGEIVRARRKWMDNAEIRDKLNEKYPIRGEEE